MVPLIYCWNIFFFFLLFFSTFLKARFLYETPGTLHHAIHEKLGLEKIQELLKKDHTLLNQKDPNYYNYTPLHWACGVDASRDPYALFLIEQGADVNAVVEDFGLTPLMIACYNKRRVVVKRLIEAGADVNHKTETGTTAFTINSEFAAELQQIISEVKKTKPKALHETPGTLHHAIHVNLGLEKMKELLNKDPTLLNQKDPNYDNMTPLHWACLDILDTLVPYALFLIEQGADVKAMNDFGVTPLMLACACQRRVVVKRLIEAGADIHHKNNNGDTAFTFNDGKFAAELQLIINEVKIAKALYKTPGTLHHAIHEKLSLEKIKELLNKDPTLLNQIDPNYANRTPLHWACWYDSSTRDPYALFLIEQGADVNAVEDGGWTPLMLACNNKKRVVVKRLIEAGADIGFGLTAFTINDGEFAAELQQIISEVEGAKENFRMENEYLYTYLLTYLSWDTLYTIVASVLVIYTKKILEQKDAELRKEREAHQCLLDHKDAKFAIRLAEERESSLNNLQAQALNYSRQLDEKDAEIANIQSQLRCYEEAARLYVDARLKDDFNDDVINSNHIDVSSTEFSKIIQ